MLQADVEQVVSVKRAVSFGFGMVWDVKGATEWGPGAERTGLDF